MFLLQICVSSQKLGKNRIEKKQSKKEHLILIMHWSEKSMDSGTKHAKNKRGEQERETELIDKERVVLFRQLKT